MGAWEGADRAACYSEAALAAIRADPAGWAPPGGGESQAAVEARMARYVARAVLPTLVPGGPPAVLVGHGLAIKCLLRRILASDPARFAARNIRLDNASLTEVGLCGEVEEEGGWPTARDAWHVLRVNDTGHCDGVGAWTGQEERFGR
jgi:broad specificity phosphatase PhoE